MIFRTKGIFRTDEHEVPNCFLRKFLHFLNSFLPPRQYHFSLNIFWGNPLVTDFDTEPANKPSVKDKTGYSGMLCPKVEVGLFSSTLSFENGRLEANYLMSLTTWKDKTMDKGEIFRKIYLDNFKNLINIIYIIKLRVEVSAS